MPASDELLTDSDRRRGGGPIRRLRMVAAAALAVLALGLTACAQGLPVLPVPEDDGPRAEGQRDEVEGPDTEVPRDEEEESDAEAEEEAADADQDGGTVDPGSDTADVADPPPAQGGEPAPDDSDTIDADVDAPGADTGDVVAPPPAQDDAPAAADEGTITVDVDAPTEDVDAADPAPGATPEQVSGEEALEQANPGDNLVDVVAG